MAGEHFIVLSARNDELVLLWRISMKKKLVFLAGLLAVIFLVAGLFKLVNGRGPKYGQLRVESLPTGSLFLDNKHLGRTPYNDKSVSGEYTIKIVPESTVTQYAGWEGKVSIGENLLTYVNASLAESELATAVDVLSLEKISGNKPEIAITTNPDGATVLLDDSNKGVTPVQISDIATGDHVITINSPGFLTRSLKIRATPGYKLLASVKLALSPSGVIAPVEASGASTPTAPPDKSVTPGPSLKVTPTKATVVPDPPKPYALIEDTPTGFLRVREAASKNSKELSQVKPGEKYSILDTSDGWYQIKYDGTNTGWISMEYAKKIE